MTDERDLEQQPEPLAPHLSLASGLLMGGADAVPGVSGGTIALIIGIYERFIGALSAVVRTPVLIRSEQGRMRLRAALMLLVPLGIGIVISYYVVTKLLVGPEHEPGVLRRPETAPICYAFFFGLVLASVREPWRRVQRRGAGAWLAAVAGCAIAASFAYLPHRGAEPALWALAFGGAGAIAIMLLPGVSGSLFLVIIGQYTTVSGALHDRKLGVIAVFLVGIAIGVITFVPLLRMLLRRVHDETMAALTGLMAGSLVSLWPWKDNYEPKLGPMTNVGVGDHLPAAIAAALAGAIVVFLLARLERKVRAPH